MFRFLQGRTLTSSGCHAEPESSLDTGQSRVILAERSWGENRTDTFCRQGAAARQDVSGMQASGIVFFLKRAIDVYKEYGCERDESGTFPVIFLLCGNLWGRQRRVE